MAINAGPYFKINPSISFILNFDPLYFGGAGETESASLELERVWELLAAGGKILTPLGKTPFCKSYGRLLDRFGLSWEFMLTDGELRPAIVPVLRFTGPVLGRAEEALRFYVSVFRNARDGVIHKFPAGNLPGGGLMFGDCVLDGSTLAMMDSPSEPDYQFNEAISLMILCSDQEEIDYYWEQLSADPMAEQCGWLKDKFGVSWQVVPTSMGEMMSRATEEEMARVMKAFMPMKKLDMEKIRQAMENGE